MCNWIYVRMVRLDYRLLLAVGFMVALMALALANNAPWLSHGKMIASGPTLDFNFMPNANWNS